jgi:hypothetical protein
MNMSVLRRMDRTKDTRRGIELHFVDDLEQ